MYYAKLITVFFRQSLQKEMAFGFNFLINALNTLMSIGAGLAGIFILFTQVESLNGWGFPRVLAVLGVYMLVDALKSLFIGPSLGSIAGMDGDLWLGRFDFTLLKPVPVQYYVSIRNWNPWAFMNVAAALALLGVAAVKLNSSLSAAGAVVFLFSLLISLVLVYSLMLILVSAAFWYLGAPLVWIYDSLIQMGRYPVKIYPGFLRVVLTWVIPVGFIVTVPAQALTGELGATELLGGGLLAGALYTTASLFFNTSLKKYTSASS